MIRTVYKINYHENQECWLMKIHTLTGYFLTPTLINTFRALQVFIPVLIELQTRDGGNICIISGASVVQWCWWPLWPGKSWVQAAGIIEISEEASGPPAAATEHRRHRHSH